MEITVKVYAALRKHVPGDWPQAGRVIEVPSDSTPRTVAAQLGIPAGMPLVVLVGGRTASEHVALSGGDTLYLFPPVVGG
jgi:molybdopterin converting factor small subunit